MDSFNPSKSPSSTAKPQLKDKRIKITSAEKKPFKRSIAKFDLNLPYPSEECEPWWPKTTIEENKGPNEADAMNQDNMQIDQAMNQTITIEKMLLHGGRKPPEDDWTEKEHQQFLMGLIRHGKGNWKKISRKFVKTKDQKQVQAHAIEVFKNFPLPYSFPYTIKRTNPFTTTQNVTPPSSSNPTLVPTTSVVESAPVPPPAPTPTTNVVDLDPEVVPPLAAPTPTTNFIDLEAETMPPPITSVVELEPPVVLALPAEIMSLFPMEAPLFPISQENNSFAAPSLEWTIGLPFSNYPSFLSGEPDLDLHL